MVRIFADDEFETVACPNCGGHDFVVLATTDRYRMGLRTVGCSGCGLVLTNPRPSSERMKKFYAEEYRCFYTGYQKPSDEYVAKFGRAERAEHHALYLSRAGALRSGMRVLDVGCAEGSLLKAIGDLFPDAERYGVEPNREFVAFAEQRAKLRRVWPTIESVLSDAAAPPFDLVTLVHVLEHVNQPVEVLSGLCSKLAEGGRLYVDVPDIGAYRDINMLHVAHLFHFSERTLAFTARKAGFEIAAVERHHPPAHPPSVRMLLSLARTPTKALDASASQTAPEWSNVRRAMSGSRMYFFRKSILGRLVWGIAGKLLRLIKPPRSTKLGI
jgi:SAM-dependent methyltransferase